MRIRSISELMRLARAELCGLLVHNRVAEPLLSCGEDFGLTRADVCPAVEEAGIAWDAVRRFS